MPISEFNDASSIPASGSSAPTLRWRRIWSGVHRHVKRFQRALGDLAREQRHRPPRYRTRPVHQAHRPRFKDHSHATTSWTPVMTTARSISLSWPVKALYLPDAIATLSSIGGRLFSLRLTRATAANGMVWKRGDAWRISELDPTAFPNGNFSSSERPWAVKRPRQWEGDTDGDGDYDELYFLWRTLVLGLVRVGEAGLR